MLFICVKLKMDVLELLIILELSCKRITKKQI